MKKIITTLLLTLSFCATIKAQDVFLAIRSKAQTVVDNPDAALLLKQLNQFKIDALDYMAMKMREQMPDSSVTYMDNEALALSNFLSLYMRNIIDCNSKSVDEQKKMIMLFMDASFSNPLFNDPDKELVLTYFVDGKSMTRFSLDTDWRRAFLAASTELKKKESK